MALTYRILFISVFTAFIVSCKHDNNNNSKATKYYTNVIKVAKQKSQTDPLPKVIHYIDSAYAAINGGSAEDKMEKYRFLCNIYCNGIHNYYQAKLYADSMLQLVTKSTNKQFLKDYILIAYYSMGDVYFGLKKYNDAFKYYYQAKVIAAATVDSFSLHDYNYRLGMVMYRQQHFEAAKNYFETSLRQINYGAVNFSNFIRKQELISNVGLSFYKIGKYDSALVYYNQCLAYLEANKDLVGKRNLVTVAKGIVLGNIGQVLIATKQFDQAERALRKSISINAQKGYDNRDAQFAQIALGNVYLTKNETVKVLPLIKEIMANLNSIKNEEVALTLYDLSYKYYNKIGKDAEALHSLEAFMRVKETLARENREFQVTDVDKLLSSIDDQYRFDLLQKNNQLQKLYTFLAVVTLAMVLLIILLVYRNYKKSQKYIVELTGLYETLNEKKANLREAVIKLEKESKSKDHILKIVAHDLRNPLHGIAGVTNMLIKDEQLTMYQMHLMSLVQSSCDDAQQLIEEILEVAGLKEVKNLSRQATDVNDMIRKSVELLQNKALEKKQLIILEISEKSDPVFINRAKMTRVINNLISNSIKFSPPNEEILVSASQNKDGVIISVKDKGIGIPPELADSIFDTFSSAKRPGTFGEKSFGLGLSICRQIVEAHSGKIWFESEIGTGTTFHVQFN